MTIVPARSGVRLRLTKCVQYPPWRKSTALSIYQLSDFSHNSPKVRGTILDGLGRTKYARLCPLEGYWRSLDQEPGPDTRTYKQSKVDFEVNHTGVCAKCLHPAIWPDVMAVLSIRLD